MMKFNKRVFKEEYEKNLKKEKARYNKKFYMLLFVILLLYSIGSNYFGDLLYNVISLFVVFAFIVIWQYMNPMD
jgi:hypothetical protein